jgi:hypothetical protein
MEAMSAARHNPILKEFYNRLVEESHRPKKVALVAVMRKLIIVANYAVKKLILCLQINTVNSRASKRKHPISKGGSKESVNGKWKTVN